jgi:DNA-binding GntR family transcriptional regulator
MISHSRAPLKTNSSYLINRIVDQIEIGILFGEFKPREHLVQDQLAERYAVERNIIRAALKKLEEKSVIEHFHNRGSVVKEISAKDAKDLYSLRFMLESKGAEMAVVNMTSKILRELETLSANMEKTLRKGELRTFTREHEKFHQLIFETADNYYLLKMIKELRSASTTIRNFSYSRYSLRETKDQLFEEHKELIRYLKKGDAQKVGEISTVHIKAGINYYLKNFFPQERLFD